MANVVTTDPIADMLTRIRNAIRARHENVLVPYSNIKAEIAKVLKQEGYIEDVKNVTDDGKKMLKITFKLENGEQNFIKKKQTKLEQTNTIDKYTLKTIASLLDGKVVLK